MGASLPPSYPSGTAAHTTSIRTNFFLDIGNPSGLCSVTRLGQRMRGEVPVALGATHFVTRSVLAGLRGMHRLFAHQLVGTRLLQDVGALLRADSQGELDRRVAFVADHVDIRAVPEQQLHHLRVARSEEHTSELQSLAYLVCRLLLEKK